MPSVIQQIDNQDSSAAGPGAAISVRELVHRYDERLALADVSFDVQPAEIFGLLGPNGSGKTTLFRILSTLMLPSGGSAEIMGYNVARAPHDVRRRIGIVFQQQSIDVKLTAAENLRHQGHLYGMSGSGLTARIGEMLERVRLADRADDRVEKLSGGQQRRLELARGLLHSPAVLLLDEPTTGLDPGARHDLWEYLEQLRNEEGISILITTHLMDDAEHCDRLAIMNLGHIVALGTPAELKREIGGDVVVLEAADPESLAQRISQRFAQPTTVVDGTVRLERENAHRFVAELAEAFPGEIQSISVSKPTLEDVFIHRTGHRFWVEDSKQEAQPAGPR
jgi:ABC-2 type transport system ATP-binding protein